MVPCISQVRGLKLAISSCLTFSKKYDIIYIENEGNNKFPSYMVG